MSENGPGATPTTPMRETPSGVIEVRVSHLERAYTATQATLQTVADRMLDIHQEQAKTTAIVESMSAKLTDHVEDSAIRGRQVEEMRLQLAGDAGERKAMDGIARSYVTPVVRAALIVLLAGGMAWLVTRGAPAGAASAQEAAERAAEIVMKRLQPPSP